MPKRRINRIISLLLAFCTAVTIINAVNPKESKGITDVYAAEDENVAYAVLTDEFRAVNFNTVRMGESENIPYTLRDGSRAWTMNSGGVTGISWNAGDSKQRSAYMYFDLADGFAYEVDDGTTFDLEFEYYSQDEGFFQLKYDGQRKTERNGDIIYTGNDKTWKTATFTLEDAYFGNRLKDKYDFMLSIYILGNGYIFSPGDVPIRNVRVTKHPKRNPVTSYFTIDESGNAFEWFKDEKIINNNLKNTTDKEQTVELKGKAVTAAGDVKWEGSQTVTLAPYEEKTVATNIDTDWCSLYDYYLEIVGDGFVSEFKPQRFAIIKTDPDGIRNERYYINVHPERWQDTTDQAADVMAKMNVRGVRFTYGWRMVQWNTTGGLASSEAYKKTFENYKNKGIGLLLCLNQFPTDIKAGDEPWHIGVDKYKEGYEKAITYIVNESPEDTLFQVWNEPFTSYMTTGSNANPTPEGFAKFTADTVDLIHNIRPSAKVGIWCLHGMVRDDVYEKFYLPAMASEYNMWENADALTQHPYTNRPIEDTTMIDVSIKKFKDEFDKRGRADIPIWNTEAGFTPIDKNIGNEENKAAFNPRMYMVLTASDLNDIYAHYNFEQKGIVMSNRETNFGIVTCGDSSVEDIYGKVYTATESSVQATAMNYLLAQITPDGDFCDGDIYAYRFNSEKFGTKVASMWRLKEDAVKRVDLGTNKIRYFDLNGNETELTSEDGTYTFDITHQPFYLVGDIQKMDILDEEPEFNVSQKDYVVLAGDKMAIDLQSNVGDDYTIDVETPVYFNMTDKTDFKDGHATVNLDVLEQFDFNSYISLHIKDKNGKLTESIRVRCTSKDLPVTSDINSSLASVENLNRWKIKINVKNESNTYLKRGYIKFNSPSSFTTLQNVDIGPIPPQKTAEVEVNCPEITEKGMYVINYDVVLDDGRSVNFSKEVDFTISAKVKDKTPIVIDGNIGSDEWDKTTAMYLNSAEQVVGYEDWSGKDDLSGYYIVSWDDDNIYLCANVTDDIHYQTGNAIKSLENGDAVSFGIYDDIEMFVNSGQGNVDYHGITLALTENGPKAYRNKAQIFNDIEVGEITDKVELAIKRENNKTYYEFKCPWKTLLGYEYTPEIGGEIWFASIFTENDGKGKRGYMQFSSGLGTTKNVNLFAKLKYIDIN